VAVDEVRLSGGRITKGVVRVAETVRRPPQPNSELVRALLAHLAALHLEIAPRYLGTDQQGREMFSHLAGEVPAELNASFSDATLTAAAQLIRRFHDATADTELTSGQEIVCHNDLSPCNFVFRSGKPVAMIDFDNAAPARSSTISATRCFSGSTSEPTDPTQPNKPDGSKSSPTHTE
jgi:aminoglycoside phosphotransferase (APT) family kinase protein